MQPIREIFSKFLTFSVNLVLWILILFTFFIPMSFGLGIRLLINLIATKVHPELTPCSSIDILLVREVPSKQPVANGGIILRMKGPVDYEKFQGLFQQLFLTQDNFDRYKNFYCDLVKFGGFLFKRVVTVKIDLGKHFIQREITEGVDYKEELAQWDQTKYEEGFPLWQVLLLYSAKTDDSYLAVKGHHALLDGYSLVHILDKLTGSSSPSLVKDDEESSFWKEVKLFLGLPKVTLGYILRNFWFPDNFPKVKYLTKVEMMPMALATVDLEPIKILRRNLHVHFPSIVYALQVGAIRRCLLERMEEDELSEVTLLTTSFPVRGHPRNTLVNHWSGGNLKIPLRTADSKERVVAANHSFEEMTGENGPYLIWKYVSYLNWILPARLLYLMSFVNLSLYRYRCSISCMPQSPNQYYLMGQPVLNIYHTPIMKDCFPQAVMLGCSSSHGNQVDFSLFGHPELFPDQLSMDRAMHIHFKEELEDLLIRCDLQDDLKLNWRN